MNLLSQEQIKSFSSLWLPAWTGNDPNKLCSFYSEDTFYLDPFIPKGLQSKKKLFVYFKRLLAKNPNWVWTQIEGTPMVDGFLNKWHAKIPLNNKTIECVGVCSVRLNSELKIFRNEVFFDTRVLE